MTQRLDGALWYIRRPQSRSITAPLRPWNSHSYVETLGVLEDTPPQNEAQEAPYLRVLLLAYDALQPQDGVPARVGELRVSWSTSSIESWFMRMSFQAYSHLCACKPNRTTHVRFISRAHPFRETQPIVRNPSRRSASSFMRHCQSHVVGSTNRDGNN